MNRPTHDPNYRARYMTVQSWHDVTPHLRRIVFHHADLANYPFRCNGAHIKLLLPQAGQDLPDLPEMTARGPVWAEGAVRPIARAYTLRYYDADACTMTVDFVKHADLGGELGPVARFVEHVTAGQTIGVSPPAGPVPMLKTAARYVLVGDATALPAIDAMIDDMDSAAVGDVFLWLTDPADLLPLSLPNGVKLHTFFGDLTQLSTIVENVVAAVKALPAPSADDYVWFAGEAGLVVPLRQHARAVWQMPLPRCYAIPYWRYGENEDDYHQARHEFMHN